MAVAPELRKDGTGEDPPFKGALMIAEVTRLSADGLRDHTDIIRVEVLRTTTVKGLIVVSPIRLDWDAHTRGPWTFRPWRTRLDLGGRGHHAVDAEGTALRMRLRWPQWQELERLAARDAHAALAKRVARVSAAQWEELSYSALLGVAALVGVSP
jgi:hypothetical protein